MSKNSIFKYILIFLISLIVIFILGVFIAINFVSPNRYKPLIINAVERETGRELRLNGDIHWKLWPTIGLNIQNATLSNPKGFDSNSNFAEIKDMNVLVKLKPLFSKQVIIDSIQIDGLNLNLITRKDRNNWSFTKPEEEEKSDEKEKLEDLAETHLELYSFGLSNSNISYTNLANKSSHQLKNIDLSITTNKNKGIYLDLDNDILKLDNVKIKAKNLLDGTINLTMDEDAKYVGNIELKTFAVNNLFRKLGKQPPLNSKSLDNVPVRANISGDRDNLNLKNLSINLKKTKINGSANIKFDDLIYIKDNLTINQIELSEYTDTNGYKIPINDIKVNGSLTQTSSGTIKGTQQINATNVSVLGFDLNRFAREINALADTSSIEQIPSAIFLVNKLHNSIDKVSARGPKDLNQHTNLGRLNTTVTFTDNVITTPKLLVTGPILDLSANGYTNLDKNYINMKAISQIKTGPNTLLGNIKFVSRIEGPLDSPNSRLDWESIAEQVTKFYIKRFGGIKGIAEKVINEVNKGGDGLIKNVEKNGGQLIKNIGNMFR